MKLIGSVVCQLCRGLVVTGTAVLLLLNIPRALTQEVGASLTGRVVDPNGFSISDAAITATNQATGIKVTTTSNATGDYVLPSLTPGTYTLTVEKSGFKTSVLSDITLLVFQRAPHGRATGGWPGLDDHGSEGSCAAG